MLVARVHRNKVYARRKEGVSRSPRTKSGARISTTKLSRSRAIYWRCRPDRRNCAAVMFAARYKCASNRFFIYAIRARAFSAGARRSPFHFNTLSTNSSLCSHARRLVTRACHGTVRQMLVTGRDNGGCWEPSIRTKRPRGTVWMIALS